MHVFLTGPVQIGKSTLIAAALDALQPERLGGFRTVSAKPEADGSRPVYLHPAAAQDLLCGAQNRVGIRRPELGIASFLRYVPAPRGRESACPARRQDLS